MVFNVNALNSPFVLDLSAIPTVELALQDIYVNCDSTGGVLDIYLPVTTAFRAQNIRIFIQDKAGHAATNNITIHTIGGETIDAVATLVINTTKGFARIHIGAAGIWTATQSSLGGSGSPLAVNMTYTQLIAAIAANSLVPGQSILLTDYQTSQYIPYSGTGSGGIGGEVVNIGGVEPLLLTATSNNQLAGQAKSLLFPQDNIIYAVTMADGHYEYASASGKGCITYRQDTNLNIIRDYDWRTVMFRRWETVIGNGLYWSPTPVAGAAFRDMLCFTCVSIMDSYVGSPLAYSVAFGFPYWLDNTVLIANTIIINNFGMAYNSHIELPMTLGDNNISWSQLGLLVSSIVYSAKFGSNNIGNFVNNTIVDLTLATLFNKNTIGECINNELTNMNQNYCDEIKNNSMVNYMINNNYVGSINDNVLAGNITGNNMSIINDNSGTGSIINCTGVQIDNTILTGSLTDCYSLNVTNSTISDIIQNNTFDGLIDLKTITPTASMSSTAASRILYDTGITNWREQILTSGILTYSSAVTA